MNWNGLPNLKTKAEILTFLTRHPGWFLEHCDGSTMDSEWWWVRNRSKTNQVVKCHASAAFAAYKLAKGTQ